MLIRQLKKKIQSNIRIFNSFENLNKIFNQKIDYTMNSIVGIDGLNPTLKIIKYSKRIAIANKESIICGWILLQKELKKIIQNLFLLIQSIFLYGMV